MKTALLILAMTAAAFAQGPPFPYSSGLTWKLSATTGTTGQNVYRSPYTGSACGTFAVLSGAGNLAPTITSYTDSTVVPGQSYCFGVTALIGTSESALDLSTDNPFVTPPAPPTGLNATVAQDGSQERATFAWTQSSTPGVTANQLLCGAKSGGPYVVKYQSSKPSTGFSAIVTKQTGYCVATAEITQSVSAPSGQVKVVVP